MAHHYTPGEILPYDQPVEDADWLALSWEIRLGTPDSNRIIQFILGPGALMIRRLGRHSFSNATHPVYTSYPGYETLLEFAEAETRDYLELGFIWNYHPSVADFATYDTHKIISSFLDDEIHTLGDVMTSGEETVLDMVVGYIEARRPARPLSIEEDWT